MKILVACEESQAVCSAFRAKGHEAYSCDIEMCSGSHPEWHIQTDVSYLLNGYCSFQTCDGAPHTISSRWDMILAFPPCTHLAVSGARYFAQKRADGRQEEAIRFFCKFLSADCDKVIIENPVGIIGGKYILEHFPELAKEYSLPRKPTQIIQPWMFGHPETKKTCLWVKGVEPLKPTNVLSEPEGGWKNMSITADGRYGGFVNRDENGKVLAWNDPRTAKIRSKTYTGVALAMAEQWGN